MASNCLVQDTKVDYETAQVRRRTIIEGDHPILHASSLLLHQGSICLARGRGSSSFAEVRAKTVPHRINLLHLHAHRLL
jgi:hypothetical protein